LRHTCTTHFGKLSEFAKVNQLRQLTSPPMLILRSTFAYDCATLAPHLRHTYATHFGKLSEFAKVNQLRQLTTYLPPRWRKLAACAQFKI